MLAASVNALASQPGGYLPYIVFPGTSSAELAGVNADGSLEFVGLPSGASAGVARAPYGPVPVVQGPDGAFWYPDGDGLGRVTTGGFFRHYALPGGNHDSTSTIAVGPDGNLWFVEMKNVATSTSSAWYANHKQVVLSKPQGCLGGT